MQEEFGYFFAWIFYGRLARLTGIAFGADDHKIAREICSTVYWMKQSKMEFAFDFNKRDFAYCQAVSDFELYTYQSLYSMESLIMQTHEFQIIMRDFAEIVLRDRGLAIGSHPQATLF